jgi:hypothetical protein
MLKTIDQDKLKTIIESSHSVVGGEERIDLSISH